MRDIIVTGGRGKRITDDTPNRPNALLKRLCKELRQGMVMQPQGEDRNKWVVLMDRKATRLAAREVAKLLKGNL